MLPPKPPVPSQTDPGPSALSTPAWVKPAARDMIREVTMHANVHDRIIVLGSHIDGPKRDGKILEVHGADGRPPYLVRWSDTGHESLF